MTWMQVTKHEIIGNSPFLLQTDHFGVSCIDRNTNNYRIHPRCLCSNRRPPPHQQAFGTQKWVQLLIYFIKNAWMNDEQSLCLQLPRYSVLWVEVKFWVYHFVTTQCLPSAQWASIRMNMVYSNYQNSSNYQKTCITEKHKTVRALIGVTIP